MMNLTGMAEKDHPILDQIMPILFEKGLHATTMDLVARRLGMSKRTLYEFFESKEQMLQRVLSHFRQIYSESLAAIFSANKENMMIAFREALEYHRRAMEKINPAYYYDMDERYRNLRLRIERDHKWDKNLLEVLNLGVSQGLFRPEVNYPVMLRMLLLQMESLKRMEDNFPEDVTLSDAYQTITSSFLRSIATRKGLDILEESSSHS